jgi:hypothetical protein
VTSRVALFALLIALLLVVPSPVGAQSAQNGRQRADAVRVAEGAIRVDGRLDEAAWLDVPLLTDFVQKEPVEGAPPSDRMEVRFAYDNAALYVAARMSSGAPIQAPMDRRDSGDRAEHFVVYFDTYLDRRTASAFGVTAAGVRLDEYYGTDNDRGESDYDPVWVARTSVEAQGWNAELRIPFSQLRFSDRDPQIWGLNVKRWIPSRNEEVYWALVRRTQEGWASRFGDLRGISGITPSRRIELLPYLASASHMFGAPEPGNPFTESADLDGRVGLDAKVGFGSNLTLEATVNPDFGQVEADPAEVNLSAFETFFDERRPFFLEGIDLLNNQDDNWFYTRRIGAAPAGRASGDFVDFPSTSTILGAAKLTGRLQSGTSIGMLGAVTGEEFARTFTPGTTIGRVQVAPRTTYGVARVQQEFGLPGSHFAVMGTMAHREFEPGSPLADLIARNALGFNGEMFIRMRDGDYEFEVHGGATRVDGEAAAIDRVQRASARYLHRPDADYLSPYDPLRTSLSGGKWGSTFQRRNARHWLWQVAMETETPELEMNDVGRFGTGDGTRVSGNLQYRETVPGRWYRAYSFGTRTGHEWNFGGDMQLAQVTPSFEVTLPNFWEVQIGTVFARAVQDERLTRGGPSMEKPGSWRTTLELESSEASETLVRLDAEYGRTEDGGLTFVAEGDVTVQPSPQWQLSVGPSYERQVNTQQYVSTLAGGSAATYGGRYIFAHLDRSTYAMEVRLNYTFKPDLTLDFYGEPFAASGRYGQLGELAVPRTRLVRTYGSDGTTRTTLADGAALVTDEGASFRLANRDFNVQSFRSNLVLRWEWRAGSTLYLVWQQDREREETLGTRVSLGDMFSSLGRRGDNFFAIKASFWMSPR